MTIDRQKAMIELAESFVADIVAIEEIVDTGLTQSDADTAMKKMHTLKERFKIVTSSLRAIKEPIPVEENLPFTLERAQAQLRVKVNSLNKSTAAEWSNNLYCARLEIQEDFLKYCERG